MGAELNVFSGSGPRTPVSSPSRSGSAGLSRLSTPPLTETGMTPLPPDVTRTIRSSCKPLLERQEQFHSEFHACLVDLMPEVPLMREPAGQQVSRWLMECVLWAVNAEDPVPMI